LSINSFVIFLYFCEVQEAYMNYNFSPLTKVQNITYLPLVRY
jgi:hypothetical protein